MTLLGQPTPRPLGQCGRFGPVRVRVEGDDGHDPYPDAFWAWASATTRSSRDGRSAAAMGGAGSSLGVQRRCPIGARAWSRNSMLPAGPGDRRGHEPHDVRPGRGERSGHLDQHPAVDLGVADDAAALRGLDPARLELGLDQDHQSPPRARPPPPPAPARPANGDEREVGRDHVHRGPSHGGQGDLADVGALEAHHPGVVAQPGMELAVTHIHGEDRIGPGLEEAVGEAARRGSGVEGPSTSDVDAESGRVRHRVSRRPCSRTGVDCRVPRWVRPRPPCARA